MRHGTAARLPLRAAVGAPLRFLPGVRSGAFAAVALLAGLALAPAAKAQNGYLNYGNVSSASPNYAALAGTNQPVSLDAFGGLRVNCIEGCSSSSGPVNGSASSTPPSYGPGTNPLSVDLSGYLRSTLESNGPASPGSAAGQSTLIGGVFNSSPPTLTNGQQSAAQLGNNGALNVNVVTGGGTGGTSSTFGAAFPGVGTAIGMSQGGNMVAVTGTSGNLNVDCVSGCNAASDTSNGAVTPGVAGSTSKLAGVVFSSSPPTLTNGQQVAAQGDSHGNLLVNLNAALPAGANVIGQVGGQTVSSTVQPTVTAGAYSSGFCVGSLMTFSGAARSGGPGSGLVQSAAITDVSGQDSSIDVILFNANPTSSTFTDHAACTVNNSDITKIVGVITASDCHLLGTTAPGVCQGQQQAIPFALGAGNTTLWAVNIARGTPTYTATTNITDRLSFLQD